jgi:HAD superfamily hydrolase (TIGR01509 family)
MTKLRIDDAVIDADLVVFDKDGTLIDFEFYWGERTRRCGQRLIERVGGDGALRAALFSSLGFDPATGQTASDGPLAAATMTKIYTVATVVLYQHGFGWDDAGAHVQAAFASCMRAAPTADLVRTLSDVPDLFRCLDQADAKIAVVTSDDHATSVETLALLGVSDLVSAVVGGNDDIPMKPAPDAFLHVCAQLGVSPARAMMVGDTVADLMMAARAGAGVRLAVLSGVGKRDELAPHADLIAASIDEIQVAP